MKTVGNIGRPHVVVGSPKPEVVTKALDLIAALGSGDKRTRKLLTALQHAVEHNERLLATVDEKLKALEDLERREREVTEAEARIDDKLAKLQRIRRDFAKYQEDVENNG